MNKYIKIHPDDNVCVALCQLYTNDVITVDGIPVTLVNDIPTGHKFSIKTITKGNNIIKYGYPIGHTTENILAGSHVHTHNVKTNLNENLRYEYQPVNEKINIPFSDRKINAFKRSTGEFGIRNELWIVPTVGCVNGQAQAIINRVKNDLNVDHLDDIRVFTHNYGCSQLGDDHINTKNALAALAIHPNAGGVLIMGLGCENNQISELKVAMQNWDENRIRFLVAQEVEDEIETGFQLMKELVEFTRGDVRDEVPISALKVGLKCGGSDGFSGITANPLVGRFSDWLIAQGGTTMLTEVPEMFGAETILMNRAKNKQVFDESVLLINNFKDYFRKFNQPIYENPSPGNKNGGISTLEDKSLGCTQKGGNSEIVAVLDYAQPATQKGLNLLNSPGNDLIASSALAFSGCQIVLFTTGRGTPFGSFVPTMKISTNTKLYEFKNNWIDFDAGILLDGVSMDKLLSSFIDNVVEVCNGKKLKHEISGFKEIAILKTGVTL